MFILQIFTELYFLFSLLFFVFPYSAFAKIQYTGYGADRMVSGSLHVLDIDGEKIILDAGAFYGRDEGKSAPFGRKELEGVSSIIISHAHSDHSGRLIKIIGELGYDGNIYCSGPTKELLPVMLVMAARYQGARTENFYYSENSRENNLRDGRESVAHLYDCPSGSKIRKKGYFTCSREKLSAEGFYLCRQCAQKEVDEVMKHVRVIPLYKPVNITSHLSVQFFNTPHIPGSVMMLVKSSQSGDSVIFSGDIGSGYSPFLAKQEYIREGKLAIIEGTYGVESGRMKRSDRRQFQKYIGKCLAEGKRVIIPSFILDRTQQVLHEIGSGMSKGFIPKSTKVSVFSQNAAQINEIYRVIFSSPVYGDYFSKSFRKKGPFKLAYENNTGKMKLDEIGHGQILVASTGMLDFSYEKKYIKDWIGDSGSVFVFVGYQDPDSTGDRLVEAASANHEVIIDGEPLAVKAEVRKFECFGSHADYRKISKIIKKIGNLQNLMIVHLDEKNTDLLRAGYSRLLKKKNVIVPEPGKTYTFE